MYALENRLDLMSGNLDEFTKGFVAGIVVCKDFGHIRVDQDIHPGASGISISSARHAA